MLRWCAGENVFAAAELPPDDPEQQAFLPWTPSDFLRREGTDRPAWQGTNERANHATSRVAMATLPGSSTFPVS